MGDKITTCEFFKEPRLYSNASHSVNDDVKQMEYYPKDHFYKPRFAHTKCFRG